MKRLATAVLALSTLGVLAVASPASAAQVCVKGHVSVNGSAQAVEQCLPE